MEKIITEALTFDNVPLVPQHSQVLAARGGAHHALAAPHQAQRYEGKRIVEDKAREEN